MSSSAAPNVLFLSGEENENDGSRIYRCEYQARQIEQAGGRAHSAFVGRFEPGELARADVVVFSRCVWGEAACAAIAAARRQGKLVCGDLDDRIYAPWEAHRTGAFRSKELQNQHLGVRARAAKTQHEVLRLLPCFDHVLTSTPGLCEELEHLGIPASVARNAVDSEARPPLSRPRERLRRLLFMTGTRTHDADFQLALPGLLHFLREHADVQLTVIGPVSAPPLLKAHAQVQSIDKLPIRALHGLVSEHDVCLVPLEATPFNDCKSALKFIECGLVSVPVIASPRREFVELIRDGENGMLAEGADGWHAALRSLYHTPELLRRLAVGARESVLAQHTVASREARLARHLQALARSARRPAVPPGLGQRLRESFA